MIWLLIAVLSFWLVLEILENFGYIESKSFLWHTASAATRGMLSGYIFFQYFGDPMNTFVAWLFFNTMWWIGFDIGLNMKRKLPIFYVGSGSIDLYIKNFAKTISCDAENTMILIKIITLLTSLILMMIYIA